MLYTWKLTTVITAVPCIFQSTDSRGTLDFEGHSNKIIFKRQTSKDKLPNIRIPNTLKPFWGKKLRFDGVEYAQYALITRPQKIQS